jgi:hypothetical protein
MTFAHRSIDIELDKLELDRALDPALFAAPFFWSAAIGTLLPIECVPWLSALIVLFSPIFYAFVCFLVTAQIIRFPRPPASGKWTARPVPRANSWWHGQAWKRRHRRQDEIPEGSDSSVGLNALSRNAIGMSP